MQSSSSEFWVHLFYPEGVAEIFICSSCPVQRIGAVELDSISKNKDDEDGNLEKYLATILDSGS
jgi:hypothetical protein